MVHNAFELIPVAEADTPYIASQAELFESSNDTCGDHADLVDKDGAGAIKASMNTVAQHPGKGGHGALAAIACSHVCEAYLGDSRATGLKGLIDHR